MKCSYCGREKPRMTIWHHPSGAILFLCFKGCQNFPEPFDATGLSREWKRIDPWQNVKKQRLESRKIARFREMVQVRLS